MRRAQSLLAALAMTWAGAACGPPTNEELCADACDKLRVCFGDEMVAEDCDSSCFVGESTCNEREERRLLECVGEVSCIGLRAGGCHEYQCFDG